MDNRPIGVYDSGIGGLTVFSKLVKILPNENFIYFGDTKNLPYGTKTKEELLEITHKIMNFYEKKNVKAVVMACNTTSAVAYDTLKNDYDFILYPVIQTVCKVFANMGIKKFGTLSTMATYNSHAYKNQFINKDDIQVFEHGCPADWVNIVENHAQNNIESYNVIKENLDIVLNQDVEKIILGCTHYPYLKDLLIKIAGKDIFLDPSEYFVKYIYEDLNAKNMLSEFCFSEPEFYVSSNPQRFKESSKIFYKLEKLPIIKD